MCRHQAGRAQSDLDRGAKWSEKMGCSLPGKRTSIYTVRNTELHTYKENSCSGNNCRTGSEVYNTSESEDLMSCLCKNTD